MNFIKSIRDFSDWSFQKLTLFFSGEPYMVNLSSQNGENSTGSYQSPGIQWTLHQGYSDIYRQDMICILERVTPAGIKKKLKRFSDNILVTLMEEELFNIEVNVKHILSILELNKKINNIPLPENDKTLPGNCYTHFLQCWKKIFRPSPGHLEKLTFKHVRDQIHTFHWPIKVSRLFNPSGSEHPRPGRFKLILSFIYHKRI
jgi:hypothetical protein